MSSNKLSSLKNSLLLAEGKSPLDVGMEDFLSIGEIIYKIDSFIYDTYKGLLDWLATTEIALEEVKYKTKQNNIRFLKTLYEDNKEILRKTNFLDVKDLQVPIITGLKADLEEVNKVLAEHRYIRRLQEELDYLDNIVTRLIDNNGMTLDSNGQAAMGVDFLEGIRVHIVSCKNDINEMKKKSKMLINEKSLKDTARLKDLVKNMKDLETQIQTTIKIGKFYRVEELESIDETYNNLLDKIEDLFKLMEIGKETKLQHHTETITLLSEYIRQVSDYLSMVAIKYYFYTSIVDIEASIIKIIKSKHIGESYTNIVEDTINGIKKGLDRLMNIFNNA